MPNILQQVSSGYSGIITTYSNSGASLVLEVSYVWGVWRGSPPHKMSITSEDVKIKHMKYNITSGGYYNSSSIVQHLGANLPPPVPHTPQETDLTEVQIH